MDEQKVKRAVDTGRLYTAAHSGCDVGTVCVINPKFNDCFEVWAALTREEYEAATELMNGK